MEVVVVVMGMVGQEAAVLTAAAVAVADADAAVKAAKAVALAAEGHRTAAHRRMTRGRHGSAPQCALQS